MEGSPRKIPVFDPLSKLKELDPVNRRYLEGYVKSLRTRQVRNTTTTAKVWRIYGFLQYADFIDLQTVTKESIENYILHLRDRVDRGDLSEVTLHGLVLDLKIFFQWFAPEKVDVLFPNKLEKPKKRMPTDQLLTADDVGRLVAACDTVRDRALVMLLWDSGARLDEILSRNVAHVQFDKFGAVVVVKGKTGERRLRLVSSVPDLQAWINMHPAKNDPGAPLFLTYRVYERTTDGKPIFTRLHARTVQNRLTALGEKAGIQKPVHPHALRHGQLTALAGQGFSEMELRIIAGWSRESGMPAVYLHQSGADVEKKVLARAGLLDGNDGPIEQRTDAKECPRCNRLNPFDAKYCQACSLILDKQTAIQEESILDLLRTVASENPAALVEALKKIG